MASFKHWGNSRKDSKRQQIHKYLKKRKIMKDLCLESLVTFRSAGVNWGAETWRYLELLFETLHFSKNSGGRSKFLPPKKRFVRPSSCETNRTFVTHTMRHTKELQLTFALIMLLATIIAAFVTQEMWLMIWFGRDCRSILSREFWVSNVCKSFCWALLWTFWQFCVSIPHRANI